MNAARTGRCGTTSRRRRLALAVLVLLASTPWLALEGRDDRVALPPHDYVVVDEAFAARPELLLADVREALRRSIGATGLAEPGYPQPCHVIRTPDAKKPGYFGLECSTDTRDSSQPDGILLDDEGHFVQLSIVDFPDSRVYLMEIYAVARRSDPRLHSDDRWSIPRVAVHLPHVSSSWHPVIWSALGRGVASLDVTVLER